VFSQGTESSEPDPHPSAGAVSDSKQDKSPREVEDFLQLYAGIFNGTGGTPAKWMQLD
jgi:hypothetical protein